MLTVNFSNHTGYGDWRGPLIDPDDVTAVIAGIEERGVLPTCDAVLSGYQGGPAIAKQFVGLQGRQIAVCEDETNRKFEYEPTNYHLPIRWRVNRKANELATEFLDDHRALEPPDPIPNSAVKRCIADGSVGFPHVRVGHRQD